jgi:very-short-patch-repair endonuclease
MYFIICKNIKYSFNCKNKEKSKIVSAMKQSLTRKYKTSIYSILESLGFEIELCRICKNEYPPININIHLIGNEIIIDNFEYTKHIYCYSKNKDCNGKNLNPNSAEYISLVLDISKDAALAHIRKNNKSPFYKENHTDEKKYKLFQSNSKENLIVKYGEIEGLKKYKIFKQKRKETSSKEYYINKYGAIDGMKLWDKICKSKAITVSRFINKYGKKDGKIYYKKLKKKYDSNSKKFFINKFGEEIGVKKFNESRLIKQHQNSIGYYISKYGFKEGQKKYLAWRDSIYKNRKFSNKSKEANNFFKELIENIKIEDPIFYGGNENNEYRISILRKNKMINYYYDFTIPDKKIIIEYNGVAFHPKLNLNEQELKAWQHPFKKEKGDVILKRDLFKKKLAIKNGFKILIIWSDADFNDNINKCIKFIKKYG